MDRTRFTKIRLIAWLLAALGVLAIASAGTPMLLSNSTIEADDSLGRPRKVIVLEGVVKIT